MARINIINIVDCYRFGIAIRGMNKHLYMRRAYNVISEEEKNIVQKKIENARISTRKKREQNEYKSVVSIALTL